ncbi:MAG: hypothetical protein M0R50_03235 [Candidatus Cloacimonetes bacterium]|jgi:hypothetical protein|nr:hypothetical protein [Candidatus Cloacimonadota bacterium]
MPSVSKAQQNLMGMVHKYKEEGGKASPKVKKIAKGMSGKAAKDFASTKTKSLPKHVKESFDKRLDEALFSEKRSPIEIKPENEGKFTKKAKAAGSSVQAYANKVLNAPEGEYPPATRKQANFAKNAKHFKHK